MGSLNLSITPKQHQFISATATEVLFGGAAGGGKSYGQLVDALIYALRYAGSKQLILRRTYTELEKSLIRAHLDFYPLSIYTYNASAHVGKFSNGSIIDFGYCATENDVSQYQSAEYDVIRFDELTHFTEYQYVYMLSRVRGAKPFPRQVKSSTNPGSVGHAWVKARFIDPAPPNTVITAENGTTRVFIPSLLDDNTFLMQADPDYKARLMALPEAERKALLYGVWDIFEGQYFPEFDTQKHVIDPFPIPPEWRRYIAFDYGLDMLAAYWIAVDNNVNCYVYKEYCSPNLPISAAAKAIIDTTNGERIHTVLAPPDLWGRSQETGKSKAILFAEAGLNLTRSSNDREAGWLSIKELLRLNAEGEPRLKIFRQCHKLITHLPQLIIDPKRPSDTLSEPHFITHSPDALRYFAIFWVKPNKAKEAERVRYTPDQLEDWRRASPSEREYLIKKYGGKPLL